MGLLQPNRSAQTDSIPFIDHLMPVALEVENTLEELLQGETYLMEAVRYAVLGGGKRFRAFLTVAIADLYGVERHHSLRAAAALEMVHAYSLVHDDLPPMDDADMRRGKPSCHVKYDEATAILVGDSLIPLAFQILANSQTHPDPHLQAALVASLAKAIGPRGMVLGQMMDLGREGSVKTIGQLTDLEQLKTGELIACACEMGATMGQAPLAEQQTLRHYALSLGLAFQIADDVLDAVGESASLGKPTGQDYANNKMTFVHFYGVDSATQKAKQYVEEAIQSLETLPHESELLREAAYFALSRMQ